MSKLADELEGLAKDATDAPWESRPVEAGFSLGDWFLTDGATNLSDDMSRHNAAMIVALRNNLPAMLTALRRVERLEAGLGGLLAQLASHGVVLECMGRETPLIELLNTDRGHAAVQAARQALTGEA